MKFEAGKSSLKEINSFMTKIDNLVDRGDYINTAEKELLVQSMSVIFSDFQLPEPKGLLALEILISALNVDIKTYKEKVIKSRLAFQQFQEIRKANISF